MMLHIIASCKILNLRHGLYNLEVRKLMEKIIQLRIELSYSITTYHIKDGCGEEYAENLLRSIMIMLMKHG
jgi:hypothetical protein